MGIFTYDAYVCTICVTARVILEVHCKNLRDWGPRYPPLAVGRTFTRDSVRYLLSGAGTTRAVPDPTNAVIALVLALSTSQTEPHLNHVDLGASRAATRMASWCYDRHNQADHRNRRRASHML